MREGDSLLTSSLSCIASSWFKRPYSSTFCPFCLPSLDFNSFIQGALLYIHSQYSGEVRFSLLTSSSRLKWAKYTFCRRALLKELRNIWPRRYTTEMIRRMIHQNQRMRMKYWLKRLFKSIQIKSLLSHPPPTPPVFTLQTTTVGNNLHMGLAWGLSSPLP